MFKRIVWMGVGVAAGSAGTVWAQKKVKTQLDRATEMLTPTHAGRVVRGRAGDVGERVRVAVAEGRTVMVETEADLRDRVNVRTGTRSTSSLPPPPSGRTSSTSW